MNRMGAQAGGDITSATTEVAKQIASTNVDFSTNEVGVDAKLDIKDTLQNVQTPQLPELQSYLDAQSFDDQVQQALNNDIEGSLTQEFTGKLTPGSPLVPLKPLNPLAKQRLTKPFKMRRPPAVMPPRTSQSHQ